MRVRTLFAVLVLVAAVFIMRSSAQTPAANGKFVAGEIIVKFRPGVNGNAKADAHRQGGGVSKRNCAHGPAARHRAARRRNGRNRALPPQSQRAVSRNRTTSARARARRARRRAPWCRATSTSASSGDSTTPARSSTASPWIFGEICASTRARPTPTSTRPKPGRCRPGSPTVTVAVIDTGIDYTHPDLAAHYAGGYDFVYSDFDPLDDHGHGTHVAGTIAASLENLDRHPAAAEGVVGVAPAGADPRLQGVRGRRHAATTSPDRRPSAAPWPTAPR